MEKKVSKVMIGVVAVLALIVVAIVVLALVQNQPLSALNGYSSVVVYDLNSTEREPDLNAENSAKIKKGIESASFSVMQGILEGKPGAELLFKKNSSGERVEIEGSNIDSIKATSSAYKLVFVYDQDKTVTVEGEQITFDRAVVLVSDSVNQIMDVEVVFYDYDSVGTENEDHEDYSVNTVLVRARTTDLYNAIAEIVA
jgi:hypothetical protein